MPCAWDGSECISARRRRYGSSACPRRPPKRPSATPSPGSSTAATPRVPPGSPDGPEPDAVRFEAHAPEPLELFLRLPLPPPTAARGDLRRVCVLPHRGRCGGHRPRPRRAAKGARALAGGDRAGVRGHAGASGGSAATGGLAALQDSARGTQRDYCGRGDGPRPFHLRDLRGSLPLLLPRGLGGGTLLHRDLRVFGPAGPRVRGGPGGGAAADQYHARRRARRARRARLSPAGGPQALRGHGGRSGGGALYPRVRPAHGARGRSRAFVLRARVGGPAQGRCAYALRRRDHGPDLFRAPQTHGASPLPGLRRARACAHAEEAGHRPPLLGSLAVGRETTTAMKAGVYTEAGALELEAWPEPAAGPGELLVRVRGCGL